MASGSVEVALRPVKFGFLIDPRDESELERAIEINTLLWGGYLNPLIPALSRRPRAWGEGGARSPSAKDIVSGYLEAFDPDFVVPMGTVEASTYALGNREVLRPEQLLEGFEDSGISAYGVGLPELCRYVADEEMKFLRPDPINVDVLDFSGECKAFMASVFGKLQPKELALVEGAMRHRITPRRNAVSLADCGKYLSPEWRFLRRVGAMYIKTYGGRGGFGFGPSLFYMDASSTLDIMDYWNLRALGWYVIPIPKQAADGDTIRHLAEQIIRDNHRPHSSNPDLWGSTSILKGRSVDEEEVRRFGRSLRLPPPGRENAGVLSYQHWYPRLWDEWARDKDGATCCRIEADTRSTELSGHETGVSLRSLAPKFMHESRLQGAKFANEIYFTLYREGGELMAEVLPESGPELGRSMGLLFTETCRFTKKGPVILARRSESLMPFQVPQAEAVVTSWLAARGWNATLSPPGRVAKQILKQLGGVIGTSLLANLDLIDLLSSLGQGQTKHEQALWGEIQRIANGWPHRRPESLLRQLLQMRVLRLGIEVQCPICTQHSWYSLEDFSYSLSCPKCLAGFEVPTHAPRDLAWSYAAYGPFRSGNQVHGVFPVLFTLRFFSQLMDGGTSPLLSFTAKHTGNDFEVDLALFYRSSRFGLRWANDDARLVFAECKTKSEFTSQDAKRMMKLAEQFPGAVIVFATLNSSLTTKEKRILRPAANRGRRYWKADQPYNPVLVLTSTELLADEPPPYSWSDQGGLYERFTRGFWGEDDLVALCDATQQLYLDLPPWQEWMRQKWERRRAKREAAGDVTATNMTASE